MSRFDIAEGWYVYLTLWHGGQGSREYARLCRLLTWFTPRPNLKHDTLSEDGYTVYNSIVNRRRAGEL